MKREPSDLISASMLIDELENMTWEDIKEKSFRQCLIDAVKKSRKMVINYETTREFMEDQKKGLEDEEV